MLKGRGVRRVPDRRVEQRAPSPEQDGRNSGIPLRPVAIGFRRFARPMPNDRAQTGARLLSACSICRFRPPRGAFVGEAGDVHDGRVSLVLVERVRPRPRISQSLGRPIGRSGKVVAVGTGQTEWGRSDMIGRVRRAISRSSRRVPAQFARQRRVCARSDSDFSKSPAMRSPAHVRRYASRRRWHDRCDPVGHMRRGP